MVGRQCPVIAGRALRSRLIVDGFRGLRATWPAALGGGLSFALAQFWFPISSRRNRRHRCGPRLGGGDRGADARVVAGIGHAGAGASGGVGRRRAGAGRSSLMRPTCYRHHLFPRPDSPRCASLELWRYVFRWPGLDLSSGRRCRQGQQDQHDVHRELSTGRGNASCWFPAF